MSSDMEKARATAFELGIRFAEDQCFTVNLTRAIAEALANAIAAEREACAELCEKWAKELREVWERISEGSSERTGLLFKAEAQQLDLTAKAIRARGECQHKWVDATNEVVTGGEICVECHAMRAALTQTGEK